MSVFFGSFMLPATSCLIFKSTSLVKELICIQCAYDTLVELNKEQTKTLMINIVILTCCKCCTESHMQPEMLV